MFFSSYFVLESKIQDNKNEFQEKVDRLRCKLAVKEKEPFTCLLSKKASKILNNLKSLEDNMTKLNQLLSHLKGNTDVSSTKYGNLCSSSDFRPTPVDYTVLNFIMKLRAKNKKHINKNSTSLL